VILNCDLFEDEHFIFLSDEIPFLGAPRKLPNSIRFSHAFSNFKGKYCKCLRVNISFLGEAKQVFLNLPKFYRNKFN